MMQSRVGWLVWAGMVGACLLTVLGICVGSTGFECLRVQEKRLNKKNDPAENRTPVPALKGPCPNR